MQKSIKTIFQVCLLSSFFIIIQFYFATTIQASVQEQISQRNQQIEEIQRQIEAYQVQLEVAGGKAKTLVGEISQLNARISQLQLEIKSLNLSIIETKTEVDDTQNQINIAKQKLDLQKNVLAKYLQILSQTDRENFTALLFKISRLSDFFSNLRNLQDTQNKARSTIVSIKQLKAELEIKQADLQDKQDELEKLKSFQELQKQNLSVDKSSKDKLLKETKGQETKFQQLVKQSQAEIDRIRDQITYLGQNGVTVEDAIKFGQLAALRVGIRPAFLIAILEVESGLGKNVGTGNWLNDMYNCYLKLGKPSRAEAEKTAFLQIISSLGLNPDTVKVSREPNYGCGGALGPAQFLPTTWLGYKEDVGNLTGHKPPSPWSIEDAFMASAVKLARAGATGKSKATETAAAKAYVSGNPKCTKRICSYYANAVLSKAAIIEQNL